MKFYVISIVSRSVSSDDKSKNVEFARIRTCNASLPCVDAKERHKLMLLRCYIFQFDVDYEFKRKEKELCSRV